jgi:superfamily II DNA or RNA helicase/HKD family nuclease
MPKPVQGLYETLLTQALDQQLADLPDTLYPDLIELAGAEAADRIALHIFKVIEQYIEAKPKAERASAGIALAQKIVDLISDNHFDKNVTGDRPISPGRVLSGIFGRAPDGSVRSEKRPVTPLLDSVLLSNSPGEPNLGYQILQEIASADRIDVIMAFIRKSGLKPLLGELGKLCADGRSIRVLTTVYTGTTEAHALDILKDLGAQVRVSYDTTGTRLHAKAWIFHRTSGFSTAYIGSSNLTHQAQHTGLEWNVRVSRARNPTILEKVDALFESYWNQGDFQPYDSQRFQEVVRFIRQPQTNNFALPPTEIRLEPFQERLLEQIAIAREQGNHRNLLVAATGTGKTVMAAVDYARLRVMLPRARLLFVAHRREILKQAQRTFCQALRDPSFGELWVDNESPRVFDHVFASIQSLTANGLASLEEEHFDVVIIDEFHHAAASSYRRLLEVVRPRELLGLTATPERSDDLSVLDYFDGRIAAELRLWDAIEQQRLCPFSYYGIHDDVDLTQIAWRRGRGYDIDGLTNVLTADDARARFVLQELSKHVDDVLQIRALGFCVSVAHARFMARVFNQHGIPSAAIWADTAGPERVQALRDLQDGRIRVLFSVDLFNEGIDIPSVDTLLMLRPTESATLFMQQLGRGLRRHEMKRTCTVLDFVGQHRAEFRFDMKLCALFRIGRGTLEKQISQGFPFLPAGCHFELQKKAEETVLASLKNSIPTSTKDQAAALRAAARNGDCSLVNFLEESGLLLEDIYKASGQSWSDLRQRAGLSVLRAGPFEAELRKAIGRLLHIDDELRISTYLALLRSDTPPDEEVVDETTRRLLRMLVASIITGKKAIFSGFSLSEGCAVLWEHPQIRMELMELLPLLKLRRQHQHRPLSSQPATPLLVHARYTRVEIQAALNDGDLCQPPPWREGVRWLSESKTDVAVFTLDKTSGRFSPTTRYRDFAIDTEHIHWESQSRTRADSPTGIRYQTHVAGGSDFLLFARESDDDRAFWFLGNASYVRHKSEAPMAITWKLPHPLPGDMFAAFAAAVA